MLYKGETVSAALNSKCHSNTPSNSDKDTVTTFQIDKFSVEVEEEGNSSSKAGYSMQAPKSLLSALMCQPRRVGAPIRSLRVHRNNPSKSDEQLHAFPRHVSSSSSSETHSHPHTCLVYLIRHGEASHNVLEKQAERKAKEQAELEGLCPEQVQERMEKARKAVLTDESLRDASLSERGHQDALKARASLDKLLQQHCWSMPSKVLVSPLTRTLETADIIFHTHDTICVHEEIQERVTGMPCDSRRSFATLVARFKRFQMHAMSSFHDDFMFLSDDDDDDSDGSSSSSSSSQDDLRVAAGRWKSEGHNNGTNQQYQETTTRQRSHSMPLEAMEENKTELRQRTRKLLNLLDESSIAVVTHKGYLRELERGTLGKPQAKEFGNGEIRVYRIHFDDNRELKEAVRVV